MIHDMIYDKLPLIKSDILWQGMVKIWQGKQFSFWPFYRILDILVSKGYHSLLTQIWPNGIGAFIKIGKLRAKINEFLPALSDGDSP